MELLGLVSMTLLLSAPVLGVVMGIMRKRTAIPWPVRFAPLLIAGVVVVSLFAWTIVGMFTAFEAVETADAASKATMLAAGISEAMNCTAAAGIYAMAFSAGLIITLIITGRRARKPR